MPSLFITGTDTDCGKTHVACALLHALRGAGRVAVGYKPVAAGCEMSPQGLRNSDALSLQAASGLVADYQDINPVALAPPIAPHLAAEQVNLRLDMAPLLAGAEALRARTEWLIVEGAGGFLVPLNARETLADLVAAAGWPVLLVVGMRLGCINHALLSAEAIQRRGVLAGWVANVLPPEQDYLEDNIASLKARLSAPCLGVVRAADPREAATELDLSLLDKIAQNR